MSFDWSLYIVDIIVVSILLISGFLAFFRGFTHEVLSISGWLGAAVVTLYGYPYAKPYVVPYISHDLFASLATGAGLFLGSLVIFWLISHWISDKVSNSSIGPLDRSLGFVFGILRGAILACLLFIGANWIFPAEQQPPWLAEARSTPLLAYGSQKLVDMLPDDASEAVPAIPDTTPELLRSGQDTMKAIEGLSHTVTRAADGAKKPQQSTGNDDGYGVEERGALDKLIENTQGQ